MAAEKNARRTCQRLIYDGTIADHYYECERPAKAWIKDLFNRSGWGGKQYLCGIHARAHDMTAMRVGRPLSTKIWEGD